MFNFSKSIILLDDSTTLCKTSATEKTQIHEFIWKRFKLYDSSGNEIDLEMDHFINN